MSNLTHGTTWETQGTHHGHSQAYDYRHTSYASSAPPPVPPPVPKYPPNIAETSYYYNSSNVTASDGNKNIFMKFGGKSSQRPPIFGSVEPASTNPGQSPILPNKTPSWIQAMKSNQDSSGSSAKLESDSTNGSRNSTESAVGLSASELKNIPPKARRFYLTAIGKCRTEEETRIMSQIIQKRFLEAKKTGRLFSLDWSKEEIPSIGQSKSLESEPKQTVAFDTPKKAPQKMYRQPDVANEDIEQSPSFLPLKKKGKKQKVEVIFNEDNAIQNHTKAESEERTKARNARFQSQRAPDLMNSDDDFDDVIVGTCQNLEKPYLRLTEPPLPSAVRPLDVLMKTLSMLQEKWNTNPNYDYTCEQLKSVRQDLTVQNIRNKFAVEVYEYHGRLAIQNGDFSEFNQCLSILKSLNDEGLEGNWLEFQGYRILYMTYTGNLSGVTLLLSALGVEGRKDARISIAVKAVEAFAIGNYHKLAILSAEKSLRGTFIGMIINRNRQKALNVMMKTYSPFIRLDFICRELNFSNETECKKYVEGFGLLLTENEDAIDVRTSRTKLST